jgi:predicted RNA binding protein YcfA (HicA-like mRNA interferase family)
MFWVKPYVHLLKVPKRFYKKAGSHDQYKQPDTRILRVGAMAQS